MKESKWQYIGVDVSKDFLDISGTRERFLNQNQGFRKLLAYLKKLGNLSQILLIFESSGGYERALRLFLQKNHLAFRQLNPKRARDFAKALGTLAKTDRVDAKILAQMGESLRLQPRAQRSAQVERLVQLEASREFLAQTLRAEQCRLQQATDRFIKRAIQVHIASLKRQIQHFDQEMEKWVAAAEGMKEVRQVCQTVCGVGPRVSMVLLAQLPELGTLERQQVAALAGVAPFARDSGEHQGKRTCYGGRSQVKRALFQAAVVASRHCPVLRDFYQRLLARGKAKMTALVAVARKLVCYLNGLVRKHLSPVAQATGEI